jgi:Domain of unknown function (DUF4388)
MTEREQAIFIERLAALRRFCKTGVLEVRAEGVCTLVYVKAGVPVFAEQGSLGETLGRVLVRTGKLTQEQYATVIARMTEQLVSSEQLRFGEVCVALGYLTIEQVNDALVEQVREKIIHCIEWPAPECEFRPLADAVREVAHYPCAFEPLVVEGLRRFYDAERLARLFAGQGAQVVVTSAPPGDIAARFRLGPRERAFVEGLDGRRTLAEIFDAVEPDDLNVLAALILCGEVRLESERVAEHAPDAPVEPARAAPERPVVVRAPPARPVAVRVAPSAPEPEPEALSVPDADESGCRTSGSIHPSVLPPSQRQDHLRAEEHFQRGRRDFNAGLMAKALSEFQRATKLYPGAIEYTLHSAWCEFCVARDTGKLDLDARERLEEIALAGVRQDRNMAFSHYVHAQLYLMQGDERAAERSFRVAAKLDPSNVDAVRHARVLARRR